MDNQTSPATNPVKNPTAAQTPPPSPRSFLSKKTIFLTLFTLIILAFIFVAPFPKYIGETACGVPCQDKNNCLPCPSEQWVFEKPLFWSVILPMLKQNSSGRYIPISVSPTPTVDPTADWKTYRNKELSFEFKRPQDWSEPQSELGASELPFTFGYPSGNKPKNPKSDDNYWITVGFISRSQLSIMGVTYCGANPHDYPRCQRTQIGKTNSEVDWGTPEDKTAIVSIPHPNGGIVTFQLNPVNTESQTILNQILSTFKFTDSNPTPTCRPRPACLDTTPRCMLEARDFCPPTPTPNNTEKACTQEAKLCPDGSSVGRQGPNCEFAPCTESP